MRACAVAGILFFLIAPAHTSTVRQVSVEELFQMVSTLLASDDDDDAAARQVESTQLTEQLSGEAVQVLKGEGAGPRTLRALDELRARSTSLPAPSRPVATIDAGLVAERQKAILGRITEYASGYVSTLPNMSCTENTRFSSSGRESGIRGSRKVQARLPEGWRLEDTVVEDVDYYQGTETYRTRSLNGAADTRPLSEIRGAFSRGELGSIMAITFGASSHANFQWSHWESLRGRRVAVFSYFVDRDHSQYWVCCVSTGGMTVNGVRRQKYKQWMSAYRGFVYADADTGIIVQLTFLNVAIPEEYNLQDNRNLVEYSEVTLGGKSHLLPKRAIHFTRSIRGKTRDEISFSNYRKFGAESTIQFPTEEK